MALLAWGSHVPGQELHLQEQGGRASPGQSGKDPVWHSHSRAYWWYDLELLALQNLLPHLQNGDNDTIIRLL